jgi:hypothetical protein
MATEAKDNEFTVAINQLLAKRALIDATIANLVALSGGIMPSLDTGTPYTPLGGADAQPTELPQGAFLNKSLPAAVKLYLSSVVKKQSIREIATALREGGVESTSDNFEGVITGCLHRMKANGELLKFKDGWALAERYPAHIRASLSQEGAPKRKTAVKKSKKAAKGAKPPKPLSDTPKRPSIAIPSKQGLEHRIEEFVHSRKLASFSAADVLQAIPDAEPKSLPLALGRLAKKHYWIKGSDGKYRVGAVTE